MRERLIHRALDARAALAAASPEPERCACGCLLSQHSAPHDVPDQTICHGCSGDRCGQPAPAAPTVEALRDALVKDVIDAYQVDAVGRVIYDPPTFRDRLIELEAAARADERTRLSGCEDHP